MSPFPPEYLRHILDETEYLLEAAEGLSKGAFLTDATLKRAFVRSETFAKRPLSPNLCVAFRF